MTTQKLSQVTSAFLLAALLGAAPLWAQSNHGLVLQPPVGGQQTPPATEPRRSQEKERPQWGAAGNPATPAEGVETPPPAWDEPEAQPRPQAVIEESSETSEMNRLGERVSALEAFGKVPIVEKRVVNNQITYVVRNGKGMSRSEIDQYIASLRAQDNARMGAERFSEAEAPGGWVGSAISLLRGYPDGRRRSHTPATREEVAAMSNRDRAHSAALTAQERRDREAADQAEARDRQAGDTALWGALRGRPTWLGVAALIAAALALCGLVYLLWRWLNLRGLPARRIAFADDRLTTAGPRVTPVARGFTI